MVNLKEAMGLIGPYVKTKVVEQIKAVAVIVPYLIFFQTLVLGIPLAGASVIAGGLVLVVFGLTLFMEGLMLGLMPLGEVIGLKLPQKSGLPVILGFAFALGMGATFAEPAIGVLKAAGSSVKAWEAPLLFLLLNKNSDVLVYSVGVGVGIAVIFGMLRFLYGWSLKPFIYTLVSGLTAVSVWGYFDPNIQFLTGLAWDCGAVTTGPVTVPLVLALGLGISRVVGGNSESGGFGVVTLASLFPILAVLVLGITYNSSVPNVMSEKDFFSEKNRKTAINLFQDEGDLKRYSLENASYESQVAAFGGKDKLNEFLNKSKTDKTLAATVFGNESPIQKLKSWANKSGSSDQKQLVLGSEVMTKTATAANSNKTETTSGNTLLPAVVGAAQAIFPLSIGMILTLFLILREKLPRTDEVLLGIFLAFSGQALFNVGIELGLSKMGSQVGSVLPASYQKIEMVGQEKTINNFREDMVQTAVNNDGEKRQFFFSEEAGEYKAVPYVASNLDKQNDQYSYTPTKGPLFGRDGSLVGVIVVLFFAFFMGYGATLAEPALNALGATVETITVGTFRKSLLMQAVAIGVGVGITLGVAKIIWNIPLIWMLAPPYLALLFISFISTEEFVNIGWDSAGVTTGPITVPLVLAMGLGIGSQAAVTEGFGVLAMASVCPILSVLIVGLWVTKKRNAALESAEPKVKNVTPVVEQQPKKTVSN